MGGISPFREKSVKVLFVMGWLFVTIVALSVRSLGEDTVLMSAVREPQESMNEFAV